MSDIKKAALAYENERGGDCLNDRTQPGSPFGECIYIFCGCDINKAFLEGAAHQTEQNIKAIWDATQSYRGQAAQIAEVCEKAIRAQSLDGAKNGD